MLFAYKNTHRQRKKYRNAIYNGKIKDIIDFIKAGADINENVGERTPLYQALSHDSDELFSLCLEKKANLDEKNFYLNHLGYSVTALIWAISKDKRDIARKLSAAGSDEHIIASNGHTAHSIAVLNNKPYPETCQPPPIEVLRKVFKIALANRNFNLAQYAMDYGIHIDETDESGCSSLMRASSTSFDIDTFITQGATLDLQASTTGYTALMIAIQNKETDNARKLINAGANLTLRNHSGDTALDIAKTKGLFEIQTLIQEKLSKGGFTQENETSVSMRTQFNASSIRKQKIFDFEAREVLTIIGEGENTQNHIQQFTEIADPHLLIRADQALRNFGGDPGEWQSKNYTHKTPSQKVL